MTEEETFNVHSITLPPFESRAQAEYVAPLPKLTIATEPVTTTSTGLATKLPRRLWYCPHLIANPQNVLNALAAEFSEVSLVLISDVHLDKPVVFQGLRKLFATLESADTPLSIVMMGSFVSKPLSPLGESVDAYAGKSVCRIAA